MALHKRTQTRGHTQTHGLYTCKAPSLICGIVQIGRLAIVTSLASLRWTAKKCLCGLCLDFWKVCLSNFQFVAEAAPRWAERSMIWFAHRWSCGIGMWCKMVQVELQAKAKENVALLLDLASCLQWCRAWYVLKPADNVSPCRLLCAEFLPFCGARNTQPDSITWAVWQR